MGIWTITEWMAQGMPKEGVELIEVGPGKGTLMDDILRVRKDFSSLKKNWGEKTQQISDDLFWPDIEEFQELCVKYRDDLSCRSQCAAARDSKKRALWT